MSYFGELTPSDSDCAMDADGAGLVTGLSVLVGELIGEAPAIWDRTMMVVNVLEKLLGAIALFGPGARNFLRCQSPGSPLRPPRA